MKTPVLIAVMSVGLVVAGCGLKPYEAEPSTTAQRLERLERQQRQEAERQRLCAMMDRETERYERDCERAGDSD